MVNDDWNFNNPFVGRQELNVLSMTRNPRDRLRTPIFVEVGAFPGLEQQKMRDIGFNTAKTAPTSESTTLQVGLGKIARPTITF